MCDMLLNLTGSLLFRMCGHLGEYPVVRPDPLPKSDWVVLQNVTKGVSLVTAASTLALLRKIVWYSFG